MCSPSNERFTVFSINRMESWFKRGYVLFWYRFGEVDKQSECIRRRQNKLAATGVSNQFRAELALPVYAAGKGATLMFRNTSFLYIGVVSR